MHRYVFDYYIQDRTQNIYIISDFTPKRGDRIGFCNTKNFQTVAAENYTYT